MNKKPLEIAAFIMQKVIYLLLVETKSYFYSYILDGWQ